MNFLLQLYEGCSKRDTSTRDLYIMTLFPGQSLDSAYVLFSYYLGLRIKVLVIDILYNASKKDLIQVNINILMPFGIKFFYH